MQSVCMGSMSARAHLQCVCRFSEVFCVQLVCFATHGLQNRASRTDFVSEWYVSLGKCTYISSEHHHAALRSSIPISECYSATLQSTIPKSEHYSVTMQSTIPISEHYSVTMRSTIPKSDYYYVAMQSTVLKSERYSAAMRRYKMIYI